LDRSRCSLEAGTISSSRALGLIALLHLQDPVCAGRVELQEKSSPTQRTRGAIAWGAGICHQQVPGQSVRSASISLGSKGTHAVESVVDAKLHERRDDHRMHIPAIFRSSARSLRKQGI
ncbi:MAG: hypothetical protein FWD57_10410, partial [Polyangiaceae bacterium]|nr:hypothetical protein [Polyangiaceae bacterium]